MRCRHWRVWRRKGEEDRPVAALGEGHLDLGLLDFDAAWERAFVQDNGVVAGHEVDLPGPGVRRLGLADGFPGVVAGLRP